MKNPIKLFLIFCFFSSFISIASGQQTETFYQTYDYGFAEKAYAVAATSDGGYIMTGFQGVGFGTNRIPIIKTDSLGNEEWHKIYGHPIRNNARAIIPLDDGGYMVGANTSGEEFTGEFDDIYLLRLDENGDTLWTKTLVEDGLEYLFDMKQCPDGGYIIAGGRVTPGQSASDGYALKIDNMGNKEWEQSYSEGNDFDIFWNVEVLPDSTYVFSGETEMEPEVQRQGWLLRINKNGDLNWSKHYGWIHTELTRGGLVIDEDHIVVAGGTTSFSGNVQYDALIAKFDMQGDTIWTRVIDGGLSEYNIRGITKSISGNYLLAINDYDEEDETEYDIVVSEVTPNNEILWTNTVIAGEKSEFAWDILQSTDGSIIVCGETASNCNKCAFLIKLTEDGYLSNSKNIDSSLPYNISIYPNPASEFLNIDFPDFLKNKILTINIYNNTGQLIKSREYHELNTLKLDLSAFPSGSYFLVLRNKENNIIAKRSIIKY
ncbi:MAG: T9SS type A sorting domain-containing protein [Saprospiraceae bacterium]